MLVFMKSWLMIGIASAFLSGHARAGLHDRIDTSRTADVSGKTVDMPTVNFDTIGLPTREMRSSPVSNQRHETAGTVEMKRVEFSTLEMRNVELRNAEMRTHSFPQSNFTPKRAAIPEKQIPVETVPTGSAPVTDRVIRTGSPAGQDELRQQLNRRP